MRQRLYADYQLEITGELPKIFQELESHGHPDTRSISTIKRVEGGDEFVVKLLWEGLEEEQITWKSASRVIHDALPVLGKEVKVLRLKAEQKRSLLSMCCV